MDSRFWDSRLTSQFFPGGNPWEAIPREGLHKDPCMRRRDDCPLSLGLSGRVSYQRKKTLRGEEVWPMEWSQHTYPRWCGVEVESHTPESPQVAQQPRQGSKEYTHRWIGCLDPSWMPANVRTRPHSPHMPVAVCLLPPPVLPPSALKHAPRPRLPGQLEPKFHD